MAKILGACYAQMTYLPKLHTAAEDLWFIGDVVLGNQEVWAADEAGRVLGFAALTDDELTHLYVIADEQNRGIGTALFRHATERRPNGFTLWTFQANDGARRFYERHGCRVVQLTDGERNEEKTPDVQYEWRP